LTSLSKVFLWVGVTISVIGVLFVYFIYMILAANDCNPCRPQLFPWAFYPLFAGLFIAALGSFVRFRGSWSNPVFTVILAALIVGSASAGYFVGVSNQPAAARSSTIPELQNVSRVSRVDVHWIGAVTNNGGSTPENYSLSVGQSFNYTEGYDAERVNYTILSMYSGTPGFTVNGVFPRTNFPQSVYVGTNFPFVISVVVTFAQNYTGPVEIYVVTSTVCCYYNGTSV